MSSGFFFVYLCTCNETSADRLRSTVSPHLLHYRSRAQQYAADCADTTAADCDYAQLARVYGQMADIFYYQGLYSPQLELQKLSVHYAWMGEDTLLAIKYYEQEGFAYMKLGDATSAMAIFDNVAKKFFREI